MKILNDKVVAYGAKQDLKSTHEYNLQHELLLYSTLETGQTH
jgi:hypothetical protein